MKSTTCIWKQLGVRGIASSSKCFTAVGGNGYWFVQFYTVPLDYCVTATSELPLLNCGKVGHLSVIFVLQFTHSIHGCDCFQFSPLMIEGVTLSSIHTDYVCMSLCIMEFFSMAYEIMEYTPSTKCSNPSESANSHIIIIKYKGKAIPVPLPFKVFHSNPPNYEH